MKCRYRWRRGSGSLISMVDEVRVSIREDDEGRAWLTRELADGTKRAVVVDGGDFIESDDGWNVKCSRGDWSGASARRLPP